MHPLDAANGASPGRNRDSNQRPIAECTRSDSCWLAEGSAERTPARVREGCGFAAGRRKRASRLTAHNQRPACLPTVVPRIESPGGVFVRSGSAAPAARAAALPGVRLGSGGQHRRDAVLDPGRGAPASATGSRAWSRPQGGHARPQRPVQARRPDLREGTFHGRSDGPTSGAKSLHTQLRGRDAQVARDHSRLRYLWPATNVRLS